MRAVASIRIFLAAFLQHAFFALNNGSAVLVKNFCCRGHSKRPRCTAFRGRRSQATHFLRLHGLKDRNMLGKARGSHFWTWMMFQYPTARQQIVMDMQVPISKLTDSTPE